MTPPVVHVVLPGSVDDPGAPSGGNTYDRRVCAGLAAAGRPVRVASVPASWPFPDAAALQRLRAELADLPPGATVLVDGIVACAAPDVVVPQTGRLRVAVLVHLPLADETGRPPEVAAALDTAERRTLQAAALVVATSAAVGRRLIQHHGLDARRVAVALPGVDPAPPASGTAGGTNLVCVAALIPRKGHDVLVEALTQVADLPWTCACAGPLDRDPDWTHLVRGQAAAEGLQGRIRFAGPLAGSDLTALYASADLLVLPSRAEPFGMVVTEALARGIPVLASAVDGIPEALGRAGRGGLPGMLVPPGDTGALGAALRRWLTQPALRRRLRRAATERAAVLPGWDETAAVLADVLEQLERAA